MISEVRLFIRGSPKDVLGVELDGVPEKVETPEEIRCMDLLLEQLQSIVAGYRVELQTQLLSCCESLHV